MNHEKDLQEASDAYTAVWSKFTDKLSKGIYDAELKKKLSKYETRLLYAGGRAARKKASWLRRNILRKPDVQSFTGVPSIPYGISTHAGVVTNLNTQTWEFVIRDEDLVRRFDNGMRRPV